MRDDGSFVYKDEPPTGSGVRNLNGVEYMNQPTSIIPVQLPDNDASFIAQFNPVVVSAMVRELIAAREVELDCRHGDARLELDLCHDMSRYWCTCQTWVDREMIAAVDRLDSARAATDKVLK
jgi:hypothetical protein